MLPLSEAPHHRALIDLRRDALQDYLRTEWEAYRLALDQQHALGTIFIGWQLGEVLCEEGARKDAKSCQIARHGQKRQALLNTRPLWLLLVVTGLTFSVFGYDKSILTQLRK